jgi:hypothetical protein
MTKRASANRNASRRKVNPLYRAPRKIGRPSLGFNGSLLSSVLFQDHSAGVANLVTDWHGIGTNLGESINRAGADVIKHYQEYKYTKAACEWIPRIGPAGAEAGARVSVAYVDNPELMISYENSTPAQRVAILRSTANCKTYNIWERFTYRVPISFRRKLFTVDTIQPAVGARTAEEYDRAEQGKIMICIENIVAAAPASGTLGQWRFTSTTHLSGFTAVIVT